MVSHGGGLGLAGGEERWRGGGGGQGRHVQVHRSAKTEGRMSGKKEKVIANKRSQKTNCPILLKQMPHAKKTFSRNTITTNCQ